MSRHRFLKRNKRIRLKEKRIMIRAVSIAVLLFSLLGFVVWGAHNQSVRITDIYVEGNSAVPNKNIKELVLSNINDKYLWLFPKNNILIYPRGRIKQDILAVFKRIYYIKINVIDLTSIVITIKERDPFALWCGENPVNVKSATSNLCFFIDNTGFVFSRAPNFSDNVYFTVYGALQETSFGQNILDVSIGKRFLEKEYFESIMLFRDALSNEGVSTDYLIFQDNNDIELYITTGGKIVFNKKQDIEKIFRDLISAIGAKEVAGTNIWGSLEYIDLRFDNKVLFKFLR